MPTRDATEQRFEVGDRVVAVVDIGGIRRPRIKRHTPGVVAGIAPWGEIEVHFGEQMELLTADKIAHE